MPIYTRPRTKKPVLIAEQNIRAVVAAIKSKPGQTVKDYRILLANDGVYVSHNTINLVLECTEDGRELVRQGRVTRFEQRGVAPEWAKLKGAKVKQPSAAYRAATYVRAQLNDDEGLESEILSDANSTLQIAADAIMKSMPSAKSAAHTIDVLRDIVHSSASREDMRAKANIDYESRIQDMSKMLASQDKLISLMEQVHDRDAKLTALTFRSNGAATTALPEA